MKIAIVLLALLVAGSLVHAAPPPPIDFPAEGPVPANAMPGAPPSAMPGAPPSAMPGTPPSALPDGSPGPRGAPADSITVFPSVPTNPLAGRGAAHRPPSPNGDAAPGFADANGDDSLESIYRWFAETMMVMASAVGALVLALGVAFGVMLRRRRSLQRLAYEVALSFGAPAPPPFHAPTLVRLALRLATLDRRIARRAAPRPWWFASPVVLGLLANGALDSFFALLAKHGPMAGSRPFPALRALAARSPAAAPGPDPAA